MAAMMGQSREFICITTLGLTPPDAAEANVNGNSDGRSADVFVDETPDDACWGMLVNDTAEHKVLYLGNETACILDLPPDVRAGIIQLLGTIFEDNPINCHVTFANDETANSVTGYVMTAFLKLSMLCLLATIVVYALNKELNSVPGWNLTCLCVSHFVHYLTALLNLFNLPAFDVTPRMCTFFGFTRHFSILCTFFWLNVMAFDIWKTIVHMEHSHKVFKWKKFAKYSAYAWGMSLAIAGTAVIVDISDGVPNKFKPMYRRPFLLDPDLRCTMSINSFEGFFIFNTAPRIAVLVANCVFFILTAKAIYTTGKQADKMRTSQRANTRFRLYLKLFFVMGLAWILNAIDYIIHVRLGADWIHDGPRWFNVVTTYVTVFIGIGIYLTFGLVPTIELVRQRCGRVPKKDRLSYTITTQCEHHPRSPATISKKNSNHIASTNL